MEGRATGFWGASRRCGVGWALCWVSSPLVGDSEQSMAVGLQDHVKGTRLRLAREGVWKGKESETGVFEGVKCQILS